MNTLAAVKPDGFIAYLRVSTQKQGVTGVSLQEQRLAITDHARMNGVRVSRWFVETRSGSRGRPLFQEVLRELRDGRAAGVIMHRIDRGARNLFDWAMLGELVDLGADVRFVHDNLDLHSRGGRLAADIQAVVAADFIRNLRDETRKGILGRFRQGLYPLPAPLGYLNNGRGRPKTLDHERVTQIRLAFEIYASGRHTLRSVQLETYSRGLRNHKGRAVSLNGWSRILGNPFYAGRLRLKSTGETFLGVHEPLVSESCFRQVQEILNRRRRPPTRTRHSFAFRGQLACSRCGRVLVGERQKGHVYYRCHSGCGNCVREERIEESERAGAITRHWGSSNLGRGQRSREFVNSEPTDGIRCC